VSTDKDPPRLSDTASPDGALLRAALRQARADVSPEDALARMMARLPGGPLPGGGGGGGATAAGGGVAATPLLSSIVAGALAGVVVSIGLWVSGIGGAASGPTSAPSAVVEPSAVRASNAPGSDARSQPSPDEQRPTSSAAPVSSARSARSNPDTTSSPTPTQGVAPRESDAPSPGDPAAIQGDPASATAPGTSNGAAATDAETETEGALLARAQAQMGSNPGGALALTELHRARFPKGTLGQEREVLAITALVGMGRTAEARSRAEALIAAHPGSAHRRRLSVIVPGLAADAPAP
jgi:hypothetical protein